MENDVDCEENRINQCQIDKSNFIKINKLFDICKGVTKIITEKQLGTGFFIKLEKGNAPFYCLMTNEHIIKRDMIKKNEKIYILYDNQHKKFTLNLNQNERFIKDYKYLNIDITIIEILKKDNISSEYFLLPNTDYLNGYSQFDNKSIVITQFPKGGDLQFSEGKIKSINFYKYEFSHLASTLNGSSGSPIFLKDSIKVLGIHKQCNTKKKENYGNFLEPVIESLKMDLKIAKKLIGNELYEGEIKDNKIIEGRGKLIFHNKEYYIGEFKNNKFNGIGVLFYENNKTKYEGQFKNGLKFGSGREYYQNNKLKYEGSFINDNYSGKGTFREKNGYYYIGEWLEGKKHGKGILYDKNKNILYEGEFIKDYYEGKGRFNYTNGDYYIREFKNCCKNGKGILYYKNNNKKFEGEFVNNSIEGEGIFYWEDGAYYIGNFKNGKRHGYGIEYTKEHNIKYEGFFKDDKYDEDFTLNCKDKMSIIKSKNYLYLKHNDNKMHTCLDKGKGKIILKNGETVNIDQYPLIIKNEYQSYFFKCKEKKENNTILICKDLTKKEKLEQEKNDENIFFEKQSCQTGKIKVKWLFEDTFAEYEGDVNLITRFPEGNGKLINKDGTYYIGEFKCGKYDGKGTLFDKNDQIIYVGYFVEGLYEGKGKMNLDKYY